MQNTDDHIEPQAGGYIPQNIPMAGPGTYGPQLDFIQELLNKDELLTMLPEDVKLYARMIIKNLAISNLSEKDIQRITNAFDDMKVAHTMCEPPGALTWETERAFTYLRTLVFTEAKRAQDGSERKLMATSINQTYFNQDLQTQGAPQGSGFANRIRKVLGRGY